MRMLAQMCDIQEMTESVRVYSGKLTGSSSKRKVVWDGFGTNVEDSEEPLFHISKGYKCKERREGDPLRHCMMEERHVRI